MLEVVLLDLAPCDETDEAAQADRAFNEQVRLCAHACTCIGSAERGLPVRSTALTCASTACCTFVFARYPRSACGLVAACAGECHGFAICAEVPWCCKVQMCTHYCRRCTLPVARSSHLILGLLEGLARVPPLLTCRSS